MQANPRTLPEPVDSMSVNMPDISPGNSAGCVDVSQSSSGIHSVVPPLERIQAWSQAAMEKSAGTRFALRIVSEDEMTELNSNYAGKSRPTNVLSFPAGESLQDLPIELSGELDLEINSLGDVAICADIVAAEARQQSKAHEAHWAHMVVHGVLHLRGYDHVLDHDAQAMEAEESSILATLGFADPYHSGAGISGQGTSAERPV